MEFDEINRILDMVREHELSEFELEREGFKIRIKKGALVNASGTVRRPAGRPAGGAAGACVRARRRQRPWKRCRAPQPPPPMRSTSPS